MKVKRKDKIRKTITFFHRSFGFRSPYKVLVDADFLFAILKSGAMLRDILDKFFEGEKVNLFITKCIKQQITELAETPGPFTRDWVGVLQIINNKNNGVKMLRCFHDGGKTTDAHTCVKSHISATDTDYSNTKKRQVKEQQQQQQLDMAKSRQSSTKGASGKPVNGSNPSKKSQVDQNLSDIDDSSHSDDEDDLHNTHHEDDSEDISDVEEHTTKKLSFKEQQRIAENNARNDKKIPHLNTQLKVGSNLNLTSNANKLFLCAQHSTLREQCRTIPIVPIIFLQSNFLLMESPTTETQQIAQQLRLASQRHATETDSALDVLKRLNTMAVDQIDIDAMARGPVSKSLAFLKEAVPEEEKKSALGSGIVTSKSKHRPKKAKGPNPLSCKPKQKRQMPTVSKKRQKVVNNDSTSSDIVQLTDAGSSTTVSSSDKGIGQPDETKKKRKRTRKRSTSENHDSDNDE